MDMLHCHNVCNAVIPEPIVSKDLTSITANGVPAWNVLFGDIQVVVKPPKIKSGSSTSSTSSAQHATNTVETFGQMSKQMLEAGAAVGAVGFVTFQVARYLSQQISDDISDIAIDTAKWIARSALRKAGFVTELSDGTMKETLDDITDNLIEEYGEDLGDIGAGKAAKIIGGLADSFFTRKVLTDSSPIPERPPIPETLFNVSFNVALGSVAIVPDFKPLSRHANFTMHTPADRWGVFNAYQRSRSVSPTGELRLVFVEVGESTAQYVKQVKTMTEYYIYAPAEQRYLIASSHGHKDGGMHLQFTPPMNEHVAPPAPSATVISTWRLMPGIGKSVHNEPVVVADFGTHTKMPALVLMAGQTSNTAHLNWVVKSDAQVPTGQPQNFRTGAMKVEAMAQKTGSVSAWQLTTPPLPLILSIRASNPIEDMVVSQTAIEIPTDTPTRVFAVPTSMYRSVEQNNSTQIDVLRLEAFEPTTACSTASCRQDHYASQFAILIQNIFPVKRFNLETINRLTFNWITIYNPHTGKYLGAHMKTPTEVIHEATASTNSRMVQWFSEEAPKIASHAYDFKSSNSTNPPTYVRWLVTGIVPLKTNDTVTGMALRVSCATAPSAMFPTTVNLIQPWGKTTIMHITANRSVAQFKAAGDTLPPLAKTASGKTLQTPPSMVLMLRGRF